MVLTSKDLGNSQGRKNLNRGNVGKDAEGKAYLIKEPVEEKEEEKEKVVKPKKTIKKKTEDKE